jgi:hypothetical protein
MKNAVTYLHLPVLAAYPVISLFSINAGQVPIQTFLLNLSVVVLGCGAVFGLLCMILKNKPFAAVLTTLGQLSIFFYAAAFSLVDSRYIGQWKYGIHTFFIPAWAVLFLCFTWVAMRFRKNLTNYTKLLNLLAFCLIILPIYKVAVYQYHKLANTAIVSPRDVTENMPAIAPFAKYDNQPNIYLIIIDEYPRADIAKDVFGYDNSSFISALKKNRFLVSENSRNNYMYTASSIPSMLNFEYINYLADIYGKNSPDTKPLDDLFDNNRLFQFLRTAGYTIVAYPSFYKTINYKNPDVSISGTGFFGYCSEFTEKLLNLTPYIAFDKLNSSWDTRHYKREKIALETLSQTTEIVSPHIAFVHLVGVHVPYVFDENGDFVAYQNVFDENSEFTPQEKLTALFNQARYIEKRVIEAVEKILAQSERPPIIVIISDHGIRHTFPELATKNQKMDSRFSNLCAVHLPGFDSAKLSRDITLVNLFRYILNHYFDTNLEILENRFYQGHLKHQYDNVEITEQIRQIEMKES